MVKNPPANAEDLRDAGLIPQVRKIPIYLFLAKLGLHYYVGFSLVAASRSYFIVALHQLLIVVASLVAEHRP